MGLLLSCGEIQRVGRIGDLSLSDVITQNSAQAMLVSGEDGLFLQHVDSGHAVFFPLKDLS